MTFRSAVEADRNVAFKLQTLLKSKFKITIIWILGPMNNIFHIEFSTRDTNLEVVSTVERRQIQQVADLGAILRVKVINVAQIPE